MYGLHAPVTRPQPAFHFIYISRSNLFTFDCPLLVDSGCDRQWPPEHQKWQRGGLVVGKHCAGVGGVSLLIKLDLLPLSFAVTAYHRLQQALPLLLVTGR